jgi:hypothetical protein
VLVPGFGGFDALGQLEYYAGVTPVFRDWMRQQPSRRRAVLHFFDNFPTASVETRASRLRSYLAKLIARGVVQGNDELALVGHSTGGLDIRRVLLDLAAAPEGLDHLDGDRRASADVRAGTLLGLVRRVAFLSVPQWGTNIADWVRSYRLALEAKVLELRAAVWGADVPLVDTLQGWATAGAARLTGADLFLAVQDALREADARPADSALRMAAAYEAASNLSLWLRQMAADFSAIDDLAVERAVDRPPSPAQLGKPARAREVSAWGVAGIVTQSYATLGRRPVRVPGDGVPTWNPLNPWTCLPANGTSTDVTYRTCYRACAGGPFNDAGHQAPLSLRYLRRSHKARIAGWGLDGGLRPWDNDGIVNTISMLWPHGRQTVLVPGDHMDIVGHFQCVREATRGERTYHTYDLLGSDSQFDEETFRDVWEHLFTFCCGAGR